VRRSNNGRTRRDGEAGWLVVVQREVEREKREGRGGGVHSSVRDTLQQRQNEPLTDS